MKYFIDEKYQNGTAFSDYESYCKSIWSKVPKALRQICKEMLPAEFDSDMRYGLHDGRIIRFESNDQGNKITIYYQIFDESIDQEKFLKGTYKGVKTVKQPLQEFVGDDSDCDIMCHEIAYIRDNLLSHTLLFASGEELEVEFSKFELEEV